jgi:hypothetical protein
MLNGQRHHINIPVRSNSYQNSQKPYQEKLSETSFARQNSGNTWEIPEIETDIILFWWMTKAYVIKNLGDISAFHPGMHKIYDNTRGMKKFFPGFFNDGTWWTHEYLIPERTSCHPVIEKQLLAGSAGYSLAKRVIVCKLLFHRSLPRRGPFDSPDS